MLGRLWLWPWVTIVSLALVLFESTSYAQVDAPTPEESSEETLRVVVAGSEPFVVDGTSDGLSLAVWRAVAEKAGLKYEIKSEKMGVADALEAVEKGDADILVGPISITAKRLERVRFSQPYYQAHLAIVTTGEAKGWFERVAPFVSQTFLVVIFIITLVLMLVGALLWMFERKVNPEQFPPDPVRGIGNGMWCAVVTATSVGYGDRVPITIRGRIVAAVWMVLAIFGASSLTATIASALTVVQLEQSNVMARGELTDRQVAVVRGTTGADFARRQGGRLTEFDALPEALRAVEAGSAQAVVFDRPALVYYIQQHPESGLMVSPGGYEPQGYGFAMREHELQAKIDVALVKLMEDRSIQNIQSRWLGDGQ